MARKKSRKELMLAKRFAVNQQVKAKYKRSHLYYSGKIVAVRTNGSYAVSFDDGDFDQNVPHKNIKALADESSSPSPIPSKTKPKTPPKQPSKQATPTKSRRSLSVNKNNTSPPPAASSTGDGDDSASTSSMDSSQSEMPTVWSDEHDAIDRCVPPLTSSSYKGSSGRIGVLGGSDVYAGAPYYAAMASLKVGADLAFVMCAKEAAMAIKSYSPELMVSSVYSVELFDEALKKEGDEGQKEQVRLVDDMVSSVTPLLDKLHVLIIGPGLGRHPLVMTATADIIKKAKQKKLALVLDADALYLLTRPDHKDLLTDYDKVVLTPNAPEYRNLTELDDKDEEMLDNDEAKPKDKAKEDKDKAKEDKAKLTPFESRMNKAIIVQKGHHDQISSILATSPPIRRRMTCDEDGGPKRSGGLGDILSGAIATFLAWNLLLEETDERRTKERTTEDPQDNREEERLETKLLACWSACCLVKRATRTGWRRSKRGMTASDVLEEIPEIMDLMLKGR